MINNFPVSLRVVYENGIFVEIDDLCIFLYFLLDFYPVVFYFRGKEGVFSELYDLNALVDVVEACVYTFIITVCGYYIWIIII